MSAFLYTRTGGVWNAGAVLPSELADLDSKTKRALNAEEGGTWAPSSAIVLGGAGIDIDGPARFDGTFLCNSTLAQFTESLRVDETFTCNGFVDINTSADISGALLVGGLATLQGGLNVTGSTTFNNDVTIGAGLLAGATILGSLAVVGASSFASGVFSSFVACNGNVTLGDSSADVVTILGASTVAAPVTLTSEGHIRWRAVMGSDSNATYGTNTVDEVRVGSGTLTTNRVYHLTDTGAANGSRLRFSTDQSTFGVTFIRDSDSDTFGGIQLKIGTGNYKFIDFTFVGGAWQFVAGEIAT